MSLNEKIANLLDLLADNHDANPGSSALPAAVEDTAMDKFASSYRNITGEDLDPDIRDRLAADENLRDAVIKVAGMSSSRPTPLGEAAEHQAGSDDARYKSKEAAERAAYDRFAQGILSIGQR